jgi:T5SS/PEP-CTERM-associated repeat protein
VVNGTITTDDLVLTNQPAVFSGATTLTTGASTLDYGTNQFLLGDTAGKTMTWNMSGGTNSLNAPQIVLGTVSKSVGKMNLQDALFQSDGIMYLGSNGIGTGTGILIISNSTVKMRGLVTGFNNSGIVSNINGTFLFNIATPQVLANSPHSIIGLNAKIEFYSVSNAPLYVAGIEFSGLSIYQLNGSTNEMQGSFTFGSGNPEYRSLQLVGGEDLWQSSSLVVGGGGTLLISNVVATIQTSDNQLTVTNGGQVICSVAAGAFNAQSSNMLLVVNGTNASWTSSTDFTDGYNGAGDGLIISNGGSVYDSMGYIGYGNYSSNNTALVTDAGSSWNNINSLYIGYNGPNNSLIVSNYASVVSGSIYLGFNQSSTNNQLSVSSGALYAQTAQTNGVLDLRCGSMRLNGGTVTTDNLLIHNDTGGSLVFNSGTINVRSTTLSTGSNPVPFTIGDGLGSANYNLQGGTHSFPSGLRIRTAASLTGCGAIVIANVVIDPGGAMLANCGGTLTIYGSVTNNGSIVASSGTKILFVGPVVNNGTVDTTAGSCRFYSGIINNGSLALDPGGDADGDGIPNFWLEQYFGHPFGQTNDHSCAGCDADGTRQNNLFKYVAGLDPTNAGSVFLCFITNVVGHTAEKNISFSPVTDGRTYTLQSSTNVLRGWVTLTGVSGPLTNGTQVSITDTNATQPQKFYRVHISFP